MPTPLQFPPAGVPPFAQAVICRRQASARLLGLAGLLGLKRRDDHVDVDRDLRADTATRGTRSTRTDTDTRL